MVTSGESGPGTARLADRGRGATRAWVERELSEAERVTAVTRLRGGWTSEMRRLDIDGPAGQRPLVLRSFVEPFVVPHAEGLLTREAATLRLLDGTDVPAPALVAVDATARYCDHPSLLMSLLPGTVLLDDEGAAQRAESMARELLRIHRLSVTVEARPRDYEAWTSADQVRPLVATSRPELWRRAVDVIRREPPEYRPCFLHRDFHPGNVLFTGHGGDARIGGVVDWVETSWGPADLDVAHCSTSLALLHGVPAGMRFADQYVAAGGRPAEERSAHLYWRLLDTLAFVPDAEKAAATWRETGRTDLTPDLLAGRLEGYLQALLDRYA
ncbi:phosphotransferase family protein [Streptomyces sp. NPDC002580]|uniref:phosphotransferase family protein n=1 Tax=Streptomyces sp. NPDC002580 TaxID=3364653 RepID=UPI00368676C1